MEQHSVPQNITGFQFKLVGDMTLKQFAEMAVGCLIGVFVFSLPIPGVIKYPIAFLFGAAGFAFAFVPINELPLDRWVFAFFRSVYSATQFFWKKNNNLDDLLGFSGATEEAQANLAAPPVRSSVYNVSTKAVPTTEPPVVTPKPEIKPEAPATPAAPATEALVPSPTPQETTPVPPTTEPPLNAPTLSDLAKLREEKLANAPPVKPPTPPLDKTIAKEEEEIKKVEEKSKNIFSQTSELYNLMDKAKEEHNDQKLKEIEGQIDELLKQKEQLRQLAKEKRLGLSAQKIEAVKPLLNPNVDYPSVADIQPRKSPPKTENSLTEIPNVLSGFIWDANKKPVSGAIIIIKDVSGNSVRALRSNQVGQFLAATPLPNGEYTIEIEKTGLQFSSQKVQLKGEVIPSLSAYVQPV